METKYFIVKFAILHDGTRYGIGEKIKLTESQADELKDSLVADSVVVLEPTKEDASDELSTSENSSPAPSAETEAEEEIVKTTRKGTAKL